MADVMRDLVAAIGTNEVLERVERVDGNFPKERLHPCLAQAMADHEDNNPDSMGSIGMYVSRPCKRWQVQS